MDKETIVLQNNNYTDVIIYLVIKNFKFNSFKKIRSYVKNKFKNYLYLRLQLIMTQYAYVASLLKNTRLVLFMISNVYCNLTAFTPCVQELVDLFFHGSSAGDAFFHS